MILSLRSSCRVRVLHGAVGPRRRLRPCLRARLVAPCIHLHRSARSRVLSQAARRVAPEVLELCVLVVLVLMMSFLTVFGSTLSVASI